MTSLRQTKWKSRVVLAAVLAVVVVVSCLFIGKMRERKPFVSKVTAGYRYRCTLSTAWKLSDTNSNEFEEELSFASTPNPIREWIATHLFHQQPSTGNVFTGKPQLVLGTETRMGATNLIKIVAGYPEPDTTGAAGIKTLSDKHFRLDGCPATVSNIEFQGPGKIAHATVLLVCTPDYATTYFAESVAEPQYNDQADREIQAVIASFHVEKVAAASGGKR